MTRRSARTTTARCGVVGLALAVLAGCGVQPSEVQTRPGAPTGLASGVTLYLVDDDGDLVPQERETGRLGTIADAVGLLLSGPGHSGLRTGIADTAVTRTEVTVGPEVVTVRLPLASTEVRPVGVDQIVCTALASHVQAGGSTDVRVQLLFTDGGPDTEAGRRCPVLS